MPDTNYHGDIDYTREHTELVAGGLYELKSPEPDSDERTGTFALCIAETPGVRGRARLMSFEYGWLDVVKGSAAGDQWELLCSMSELLKNLGQIGQEVVSLRTEVRALKAQLTRLSKRGNGGASTTGD